MIFITHWPGTQFKRKLIKNIKSNKNICHVFDGEKRSCVYFHKNGDIKSTVAHIWVMKYQLQSEFKDNKRRLNVQYDLILTLNEYQ